jgi:inorganic pyrophosphatase
MVARRFIGKEVKVTVDRPLGSRHPEHGFAYLLNYGYLDGVPAADGEDQDAYILGVSEPVDEFVGVCIAVLHRENDVEDKLIVAPRNCVYSDDQILAMTAFVESSFKVKVIRQE